MEVEVHCRRKKSILIHYHHNYLMAVQTGGDGKEVKMPYTKVKHGEKLSVCRKRRRNFIVRLFSLSIKNVIQSLNIELNIEGGPECSPSHRKDERHFGRH